MLNARAPRAARLSRSLAFRKSHITYSNFGSVKMFQSGSGMKYNKHSGAEVVPRTGRG